MEYRFLPVGGQVWRLSLSTGNFLNHFKLQGWAISSLSWTFCTDGVFLWEEAPGYESSTCLLLRKGPGQEPVVSAWFFLHSGLGPVIKLVYTLPALFRALKSNENEVKITK